MKHDETLHVRRIIYYELSIKAGILASILFGVKDAVFHSSCDDSYHSRFSDSYDSLWLLIPIKVYWRQVLLPQVVFLGDNHLISFYLYFRMFPHVSAASSKLDFSRIPATTSVQCLRSGDALKPWHESFDFDITDEGPLWTPKILREWFTFVANVET